MKLIQHHKYIVSWIDAFTDSGWIDIDTIHRHMKAASKPKAYIRTIGYFVTEDDDWLVLASDFSGSDWGNPNYIPKAWIKTIKQIRT